MATPTPFELFRPHAERIVEAYAMGEESHTETMRELRFWFDVSLDACRAAAFDRGLCAADISAEQSRLDSTPDAPLARCSVCGEPTGGVAEHGAQWYLCVACATTDEAAAAERSFRSAPPADTPYTYHPHGEFCADDAIQYDTAYDAMDALESGDEGGVVYDAGGRAVAIWRLDGGIDTADSFRARASSSNAGDYPSAESMMLE